MGVYLVVGAVAATICAFIANAKGRSVPGYAVMGFLFPVVGLIVSLVVSNLREEERRRHHDAAERRRLREQLQQERMKTDALRHHTVARLDLHDQALDMDTRSRVPVLAASGAAPLPPGTTPPPVATWHYVEGGERRGPVSTGALVDLLRSGRLADASLVWRPGMSDWVPAREVEDLAP